MASSRTNTIAQAKRTASTLRGHARNKKLVHGFFVFIGVVLAFSLGIAVRSNIALAEKIGLPVGAESMTAGISTKQSKTPYDSLSARVEEVEDILSTYSMDTANLDSATVSMLNALLQSTGDPYAEYYDQKRYESYIKESVAKEYRGIGVLFGDYNGRAYAIDVLEGSEAQAKGVLKGDFVQAINGDSAHNWSASEVIGALGKDEGESVVVTWMRPISLDAKNGTEFTTTLVSKEYTAPNVAHELKDGGVGYLRLRQLTANSSELLKRAVQDLEQQGAQTFVLDLRDNPGGYLTQALDAASLFIPSGSIVGIKTLDGVTTRTATGATITNLPLVVLVNSYTSGAAEVLAAALQGNQRATVVGQTTMGKGSVQVIRELTFGGAVRYTAAFYLSPSGREINGVGVTPNLIVGTAGDDDTQMLVAIDTAKSLTHSQ